MAGIELTHHPDEPHLRGSARHVDHDGFDDIGRLVIQTIGRGHTTLCGSDLRLRCRFGSEV